MAIELRVVQFWSDVKLAISNQADAASSFAIEKRAYDFRQNCFPLSSIAIVH